MTENNKYKVYILYDKYNDPIGYVTDKEKADLFVKLHNGKFHYYNQMNCLDDIVSDPKHTRGHQFFSTEVVVRFDIMESKWECHVVCAPEKYFNTKMIHDKLQGDDIFHFLGPCIDIIINTSTDDLLEIQSEATKIFDEFLDKYPLFKEGYIRQKDIDEFNDYLKQKRN